MPDIDDAAVLAELRQVSSYLRELASFNRRAKLAQLLEDPERQRAYELSDGHRSRNDVAADDRINSSGRTISRWWAEWVAEGIATRSEGGAVRARYDVSVIESAENG